MTERARITETIVTNARRRGCHTGEAVVRPHVVLAEEKGGKARKSEWVASCSR
jgi:hypothetical protein